MGALFIVGATEIFYRLYEATVKSCVERSLEEAKEEHARIPATLHFEKTAAPPGLEEEIKTEGEGSERGREHESVADSVGEEGEPMKAAAETVTMPTRNRFITIVSHAKRMREFAIERSPLDTNRGLLEGDHTIAPPETEARPNTFLSPENRNFRGTQTTMRSFNQYDTAREEGTPDSAQRDHQRVGSQVVNRL